MGQHPCMVQGCHGTTPLWGLRMSWDSTGVGSRDVMGQHSRVPFKDSSVYVFPIVFHLEKDDRLSLCLSHCAPFTEKKNVFSLCSLYRKRAVCIFLTVLLLEKDGSVFAVLTVFRLEKDISVFAFFAVFPLGTDISVFLFLIVFPA